jgi:hypothetical protein
MIIIRDPLSSNFTKVDRRVFTKRGISDGAKVLYGYLSGLPTGQKYTDSYLVKALDVSMRTIANRKKELTNADLILVSQISARNYMLFIGRTDHPASLVKMHWERENDG